MARRHGSNSPPSESGFFPWSENSNIGVSSQSHLSSEPPGYDEGVGSTHAFQRWIVQVVVVRVGDQDAYHSTEVLRAELGWGRSFGENSTDSIGKHGVGDESFTLEFEEKTRVSQIGDGRIS